MQAKNTRRVAAQNLKAGDVFDAVPLFEWFCENGFEYNESDRLCAEAEAEVVESVTADNSGYAVIITSGSVFYSVPSDHPVTVRTV